MIIHESDRLLNINEQLTDLLLIIHEGLEIEKYGRVHVLVSLLLESVQLLLDTRRDVVKLLVALLHTLFTLKIERETVISKIKCLYIMIF